MRENIPYIELFSKKVTSNGSKTLLIQVLWKFSASYLFCKREILFKIYAILSLDFSLIHCTF